MREVSNFAKIVINIFINKDTYLNKNINIYNF